MRIKVKTATLGDDDQIYNPGSVIEVHDDRAKYFIGMGDAEKAGDKDEVTPPPPPLPTRASIEERAIKAAVQEAIKVGGTERQHVTPQHGTTHKK
jgi:hypothetical protein